MEELKRIPFGGNLYTDFDFFNLELKVSDIKYTPEQIDAHLEFSDGRKVDIQGIYYPSLIRRAVPQINQSQVSTTKKLTAAEALKLAKEYSAMPQIMNDIRKAATNGLTCIKTTLLSDKDRLRLHEMGYKISEVTERLNNYAYCISWNDSDY